MGLLSDLIGNAALTGHEMLSRENKAKQEEEASVRSLERQLAKSKELSDYQAIVEQKKQIFLDELKANRERLNSEKLAQQEGKIEDVATQTGLDRDAETMTIGASRLPSEGEYAGQAVSPEEIANLPPAARVAYEQAGLLNSPLASQVSKDRLSAARALGADQLLVKSYRDQMNDDSKAEKAQAIMDFKERQAAQEKEDAKRKSEQKDKELDIRDRQVTGVLARIGSGSGPAFVETYKFLEQKGYKKSEIEAILTEKKGKSVEDIAIDLLNKDPNAGRRNAMTTEQALSKAKEIKSVISESTVKTDQSTNAVGKSAPVPKRLKYNPATGKIE